MPYPWVTRAALAILLTAVVLGLTTGRGAGAPRDDLVLPVDQHSSEKARRLATAHQAALRQLGATIAHCLPWVVIHKQSLGFFKPKHATEDERYLSLRVYIEQDESTQFARFGQGERLAAMFSRYVGPLLRRMAADQALLGDPALDGFSLILDWRKPGLRAGSDRPVRETLAVFVKTPVVSDYLAGRLPIAELSEDARVLGWDGETALGPLQLKIWEDDFVARYQCQSSFE